MSLTGLQQFINDIVKSLVCSDFFLQLPKKQHAKHIIDLLVIRTDGPKHGPMMDQWS